VRGTYKNRRTVSVEALVTNKPDMASPYSPTYTTPATPPPAANSSDKPDMEMALGLTGRRRDECMTKKSGIEVSTETDAVMRTV
jgi:hypothetical protein